MALEGQQVVLNKNKEYVVSFSGGKDSTALLLKMLEEGYKIHSVLYFDTEKEYPEIKEHIENLKATLPVKFVTVRHWVGFDFLKERYGDASAAGGWCTAVKRDTCLKYLRLVKKENPDIAEVVGFTNEEPKRILQIKNSKRRSWEVLAPLAEVWDMSEEDCLQYCYSKGYRFGEIYEWMPNKRTGCFDCPKLGKKTREIINKKYGIGE